MDKELWTISSLLQWTEQYFRSKGIESSRLDGEVLLSHVLGVERIYLYTHFDKPLEQHELDAFRPLVIERVKGYSVAAIIGHKEFMGLNFHVNRHVLIPRPDTETVIEDILAVYDESTSLSILDLCIGPGTILLSLLHYLPQAKGLGIDISKEALEVCRSNQKEFQLEERSALVEADILRVLQGHTEVVEEILPSIGLDTLHHAFDIVLSNPPYITTEDMKKLSTEVLNEPHIALHGGIEGLDFYIPIIQQGWKFVKDGGYVAIEIGQGQEEAVAQLAKETGHYEEPIFQKDIGGIIRSVRWKVKL